MLFRYFSGVAVVAVVAVDGRKSVYLPQHLREDGEFFVARGTVETGSIGLL